VATPTPVGDVSVAVYDPLPLSVTAESEPAPVRPRATIPPEPFRSLPAASLSCTVIVLVDVPFATIDVGEASIVLVRVEPTPAVIT
jgi:hypothetical protein